VDKEKYLETKIIPYYEETQKRTIFQKIRKIKNTFLLLLAYACPSSKIRIFLHRQRGVKIGKGCYIGMFVFFDNLYPEYIYIEDEVSINTGSMLIAHFNPMKRYKNTLEAKVSPIIIKEGVIISVKSIILPGVTIGENSIISAGSVVSDNIGSNLLVRGNPAKPIGRVKLKN